MKLINRRYVGKQPVYNLMVDTHHNFIINQGIVVHNCDSLRYFCASRIYGTVKAPEPNERELRMRREIEAYTSNKLFDVYGGGFNSW